MIVTGLIIMLIGFVIGAPFLWSVGVIVLLVGLILLALGTTGRGVGGRRHYY